MFDGFVDKSILTSQSKYISDGAESVNFSIFHKGVKIVAVSVPESAIANKDKPVTVTIRAIDSYIAAGENTQSYAYDIDVTNLKSNLKGDQLVTVVISAPKGLAAMKAYHKNELLTDAVYDEVAGAITFKTASFSPYAIAADYVFVDNLKDLRTAMQNDGANIVLSGPIEIDLSKNGSDRSQEHMVSGYYNAVNIVGKDVSLDLNGQSIAVSCGEGLLTDNEDVGALFYVGANGSLNIRDNSENKTGYIKMKSSIYAVWAPHADPSYAKIFGGIFIADSYAGDLVGTALDSEGNADSENGTMSIAQENANRALIYAGHGGNINIYGGYFLYNNTVNDISNRNNGAFNAKDYYEDGALITIHEGVYLSNKEYRQNPQPRQNNASFDDYSVVLSQHGKVSENTVNETIKIGEEEFARDWYKVVPKYAYKVVFKSESSSIDNLDTYYAESNTADLSIDTIDDIAFGKLDDSYKKDFGGWVTAGSKEIITIDAGNQKNYILYPSHKQKITVRFVDQNGNILKETKLAQGDDVTNDLAPTISSDDDFLIREWEENWITKIQNALSAKEDVTIYLVYRLDDSKIKLIPVDADQDGITEEYQVAGYGTAGSTTLVAIPEYVNGVPVTEVNADAFSSYDDLHSVVIPATVTVLNFQSFTANQGSSWNPKRDTVTIYYDGNPNTWNAYMNEYSAKNYEHLKQGWDNNMGDGSRIFFLVDGKVDNTKYWEYDGSKWMLHDHAYSYDAAKTCLHGEKSHYEYGGGFIGIGASLQKDKFTNYAGPCDCDSCNGATRPDAQYWN